MEYAIEQATQVLIKHPSVPTYGDAPRDVCPSCPDADVAGPNSPSHAAHQARALAEAGLLSPEPLRHDGIWRAVGPDGEVWAESSNETEVRERMRQGDTLFACYRAVRTVWLPVDCAEGDSEDDEDIPEPVREEWSTYDPNNTDMWGRTNFRADSEEQARELAFKFGYEVHRRLVSGETKTKWERVE